MEESLYDLELDRIISTIKEKNAKKVCLQLPDGLKPHAKELADAIEQATQAKIILWAGSNFGACDIPIEISRIGVDLLVHFGHSEWVYDKEVVK